MLPTASTIAGVTRPIIDRVHAGTIELVTQAVADSMDLWRQLPFAVLLATHLQERKRKQAKEGRRWGDFWHDSSGFGKFEAYESSIADGALWRAVHGLWRVGCDSGDYRLMIDLATGTFTKATHYQMQQRRTPEPHEILWAAQRGRDVLLDPTPLVEAIEVMLDDIDDRAALADLWEHGLVPSWCPEGETWDERNTFIHKLSLDWPGSVRDLLACVDAMLDDPTLRPVLLGLLPDWRGSGQELLETAQMLGMQAGDSVAV